MPAIGLHRCPAAFCYEYGFVPSMGRATTAFRGVAGTVPGPARDKCQRLQVLKLGCAASTRYSSDTGAPNIGRPNSVTARPFEGEPETKRFPASDPTRAFRTEVSAQRACKARTTRQLRVASDCTCWRKCGGARPPQCRNACNRPLTERTLQRNSSGTASRSLNM
jgi:hypothetical protein